METCFMFTNQADAKEVETMLANYFDVKHTNYIDFDVLSVPKNHYREAISLGINFIKITDIKSVWWVNEDNVRIPIDVVPLLFAEIPEKFKSNPFFSKIATFLCKKYAKRFSRRIKQKVLIHYNLCNNVEFYLTRCYETTKNHKYIRDKITAYCRKHYHIFNYIDVYDAYGQTVATITKKHHIEFHTKTPH